MNADDLKERLKGNWQRTLTGQIPEESVSLDTLAEILVSLNERVSALEGTPVTPAAKAERKLKPGVTVLPKGSYMLHGKFISKSEAFE